MKTEPPRWTILLFWVIMHSKDKGALPVVNKLVASHPKRVLPLKSSQVLSVLKNCKRCLRRQLMRIFVVLKLMSLSWKNVWRSYNTKNSFLFARWACLFIVRFLFLAFKFHKTGLNDWSRFMLKFSCIVQDMLTPFYFDLKLRFTVLFASIQCVAFIHHLWVVWLNKLLGHVWYTLLDRTRQSFDKALVSFLSFSIFFWLVSLFIRVGDMMREQSISPP